MKNLLFLACLFGSGLVAVRLFTRAPEPTPAGENRGPAPSAAAGPSDEPFSPWQAWRRSVEREPVAEAMSAALRELPEDHDALREWARENPGQALTWLQGAPAGDARDTVLEILCARVAESNPADAVSLAERYAGGVNLLENLVHQWADQNEPSARAYALAKPPGDERDRLLSRIALIRAKENPHEAAMLVAEWIAPGDVQNEAAMSVFHQWATRDPNAALAWGELFPDDTLRNRALREMANIFVPREE